MKAKPNAKAAKPPSEARVWLAVLTGGCVMALMGAARAVFEGASLSETAPGLAGAVLAGPIGWAGLRAVQRRDDDMLWSSIYFFPALRVARGGFWQTFIPSLGAALAVTLVFLALSPLRSKPVRPSPSDHPLYDADLDGATGAGGESGRVGRG